ncbi:hypothetical protein DL96DRAFT_1602525 [Flagelloscypha sp. PMI_526]|nr:hypothetical protein DL96DRAFT_1602525 [Flagelloscypha sp. PMI_526]
MSSERSSPSSSSRLATPDDEYGDTPMLSIDDILQTDAFESPPSTVRPFSLLAKAAQPQPALPLRHPDPSLIHHKITFPDRNSVQNLSLVFPSLPSTGSKSRVETQVRVIIDLADNSTAREPMHYDRVGSWKWLKLPEGTATKKRVRKQGRIGRSSRISLWTPTEIFFSEPSPEDTLFLSTSAKRVAKKLASRVKPEYSDSDAEGEKIPSKRPFHEDTSSILHFNCSQVLELSSGQVALPMRITCYCRHHKEKLGFNVHFTMVDHTGRIVATGSTPHIMITDDHKTMLKSNDATQQSSPPAEETRSSKTKGGKGVASKASRKRVKPYDSSSKPKRRSQEPSGSGPPSPGSPLSHLSLMGTPTPPPLEQIMHFPALQGSSMESESSQDALSTPLDYQSDVPMTTPQDDEALFAQLTTLPSHPHSIPFLFGDHGPSASLAVPTIHRLIPNSGPTHGGIEVTVLGANFHATLPLQCVFGDVASTSVQRWSDNTLVCILPPRATPGAVPVYFQGFSTIEDSSSDPAALFTYTSESDRALMELALQVVGLKMTGRLEDAKHVAMRIVGSTGTADQTTPTMEANAPVLQFALGSDLSSGNGVAPNIATFMSLLDSEALCHRNPSGQTLLHLAAFSGYMSLVEMLIKHNVDLDVRDRNGCTPLHFAVLAESNTIICALLAGGADPEVVDGLGRTPSELASPILAELFPQDSTDSRGEEDEDDEAQWGDVEDESAPSPIVSRSKRSRFTHTPVTTSRSSSPDPERQPKALDRKKNGPCSRSAGKHCRDDSTSSGISLLFLISLPSLNSLQLCFQVNLPGNPNLLPAFPALFGGESEPINDDKRDGAAKATALNELRAMWEKWFAVAVATALRQQQVEDPPPEYTPRQGSDGDGQSEVPALLVDESSSRPENASRSHSRRTGSYTPTEIPDTEVEQYAPQPTRKQKGQLKKKDDLMLMLFWIPVLLLSVILCLHGSIRFAFQTIKSALPVS